jgi:16S rRNA C1402 (ribose-2'-O) methylase RsmI
MVQALLAQGQRTKDAVKEVAEHTGLARNELYAAVISGKD